MKTQEQTPAAARRTPAEVANPLGMAAHRRHEDQAPEMLARHNPMAERERRIREAAYRRAEARGFAPGHELEDWLAAEDEVDTDSRPLPRA